MQFYLISYVIWYEPSWVQILSLDFIRLFWELARVSVLYGKYLKRLLPPFYFLKSLNFATQRHRNSVHTHYIIWLLNFLLLPWVCKNLSQNLDCNTNYCRERVFGEGKPSYFFVDLQNSGDYWKSASIFMRFQRGGGVQLLETEHSDAHEQSYQLDSDLLRHIQSGSFQCMCCQMFALALLY
jgi:hypothetical protein